MLIENNPDKCWPLEKAKAAIVVGGCCGMAFTQLTTSPATVQFARSMGATGLHIGILAALPMALIGVQLLAAIAVNRMTYRKPVWFWVSIIQRLVFLPAALGPWLWPQVSDRVWIWTLIALTALNHGLLHFGTPLWLSWMGDYLPHQGLNRFWGRRHSSQQWTAAMALFANALFFFGSGVNVRAAFAAIIALGCALGVVDILMFARVAEPPVKRLANPRLWDVLAGPFRQREFRSFIRFSCFWNVAAMVGAPFISMYLFEFVGMDLFRILLLWTLSWVGGAMLSGRLGQWAEHFGQRPVLIFCTAFKSLAMVALLSCPPNPTLAFWILAPVFMFDAFLNAGILIANNGFMIKNSPRENRTMFIAAGTAFAGMVGGLTSIVAGQIIEATSSWSYDLGGMRLVNFHLLFAVSVLLRLWGVALATQICEPSSAATKQFVLELVVASRTRFRRIRRTATFGRANGFKPTTAVEQERRAA